MITILMAAYNGQKYIAEQIDSILCQTEQNWKLMIQDDGSSDGTFRIAQDFARRYPKQIQAVRRTTPSGSAQANFFSMLPLADSEYVMFCDDDDVWLPEKTEVTLSAMKRLEKIYGADKPLLVHTDLKVVDSKLNTVSDSMIHTQKLGQGLKDLNHLLVQNNVTGCTMMVNRHLLDLAARQGLPQHAVMHDWWFALISAAFGGTGFVPIPTILYRQHGGNQVGAKNASSIRYNSDKLKNGTATKYSLDRTYRQAKEFLGRFSPMLNEAHTRLLRDFISIPTCGKAERIHLLIKDHFWKSGFLRRCGQIWFT
ncbi:MAG: glycosyltransferase family 2 protein [Oscillospiraceae bacterium]|jgi:glycosyltransferase involved in cell wall biosynthesis|nr:glycosyltransferase family 2 protein [Oscillospiraceae bacterium]